MSTFDTNLIMRTDSYKISHWRQYPAGTEKIYSYFESRGGRFDSTLMFGLNYYLKEYLSRPITMQDIDEAEKRFQAHFGRNIFNRRGWERIVQMHNGFLPVEIRAVPEGTLVPNSNVLLTVVNTDPELPWVTNYVETVLAKLWYPITVATTSFEIKRLIKSYLERTGDPAGLNFKLHDFGARGVSSEESAVIGGMAHLINFMGTDTIVAFEGAKAFYGEGMAGFSVPAAEHSTITSWGRHNETEAYRNMIRQFGDQGIYAVVSDSYDIYNACENLWGGVLKQEVLGAPATLVVRPDSGIPHEVVLKVTQLLGQRFGFVLNDKGFKVLNKVRVIQGDGIEYESIKQILDSLTNHGWSADNITFGMGGALLQKMDRDTNRFAFKCSATKIDGVWVDVWKDPVTDQKKASKRGRLALVETNEGMMTVPRWSSNGAFVEEDNLLQVVWKNGEQLVDPTFSEIRERVDKQL